MELAEEGWFFYSSIQESYFDQIFIKSEEENVSAVVRLPYTDEYLNKIDMYAGGKIFSENAFIFG